MPTRTTITRLVALPAVGALTFAVAACGPAQADGARLRAGTTTAATAPAQAADVAVSPSDRLLAIAQATASQSFHVSFTVPFQGQQVALQADVDPVKQALRGTARVAGSDYGIVVVDGKAYASSPFAKDHYFRVDTKTIKQVLGVDLPIEQVAKGLGDLKPLIDRHVLIEPAGWDRIDGVDVSKHTVTVDLASALKDVKDLPLPSDATAKLPEKVVVTIALDAQNRLIWAGSTVDGKEHSVTLGQFGDKVDIQAPAADKVQELDLGNLAGALAHTAQEQGWFGSAD